jgi:hypothetical protein
MFLCGISGHTRHKKVPRNLLKFAIVFIFHLFLVIVASLQSNNDIMPLLTRDKGV